MWLAQLGEFHALNHILALRGLVLSRHRDELWRGALVVVLREGAEEQIVGFWVKRLWQSFL